MYIASNAQIPPETEVKLKAKPIRKGNLAKFATGMSKRIKVGNYKVKKGK